MQSPIGHCRCLPPLAPFLPLAFQAIWPAPRRPRSLFISPLSPSATASHPDPRPRSKEARRPGIWGRIQRVASLWGRIQWLRPRRRGRRLVEELFAKKDGSSCFSPEFRYLPAGLVTEWSFVHLLLLRSQACKKTGGRKEERGSFSAEPSVGRMRHQAGAHCCFC